jgi:acetophenone carboxylase
MIATDILKGIITHAVAENVYKVVWDEGLQRVDREASEKKLKAELTARIKRGKPYAEFVKEWEKKKPPEEILAYYGSWPDAKITAPIMRA